MEYFKGLSLHQISKNAFAQLVTKSITTTGTFTGILILTYFQGFELLGEISKVITFVSFFYLLADLGLNAMYIKYYYKRTEQYMGNLILTRLGISVALATISILISALLPYNPITDTGYSFHEKVGIALFSLTIITHALTLSLNALLQKELKHHLAIIPSMISGFMLLTLIFLGAKTGNLYLVLTAYVTAQLIFFTLLYKKLKEKYRIRLHTAELKDFSFFLLKVSSPLILVLFCNLALTKSDMFVLSLFQPSFDVGVYSFAYKIFDFLIIIPTYLASSMYPILLKKDQSGEFMNTVKKYALLLAIGSAVVAAFTFTASPLLKYLRGDFSLSVAPLQILSLSLPFFFLTSLMQWTMIVRKKITILAGIYALAMTVSITLNILYIPHFSYFAAAAITVLTEGLVFVLMIIYFMMQQTKIFQKQP